MYFRATNFTVTMLVLVAFTVFIAGVRFRRPLDSNWPLLYWVLMIVVVIVREEQTFYMPPVLAGAAAGLLLRFEFMASPVSNVLRLIELGAWGYIIYRGLLLATSY